MLHASVRNKFDKPISLSSALHKKDGERGRANALPLTPFFRHLPRLFPQPRRRHRCLIIYWQVLFNGLASLRMHRLKWITGKAVADTRTGTGTGILKTRGSPSVAIYCQLAASHSKAINFLLDYIKFTNDLSMPNAASVSPSNPIVSPHFSPPGASKSPPHRLFIRLQQSEI